jgi:hypothetical protein
MNDVEIVLLTGEARNTSSILAEKPLGQRPLERPRQKWRIILKRVLRK